MIITKTDYCFQKLEIRLRDVVYIKVPVRATSHESGGTQSHRPKVIGEAVAACGK